MELAEDHRRRPAHRARGHDAHHHQRRHPRARDLQPPWLASAGCSRLLDHIILAVFVIEIAARIVVHRLRVLPRSLERVRLHRGRHRAGAGDRDLLGAARAAHPARAAPDHRRADAQARGRGPARLAARHGLDRAADRAHLLRIRGDGDQAVRRGQPGPVRHARQRAVHPVHGDDARRLDRRRRQAGDGDIIPMPGCSSSSSSW